MVLVLVVGDQHVPQRAALIPAVFRKMLVPGRIDKVFITGNVASKDMYRYFRSVAPEVYCTRGELDMQWSSELPETVTVEVEDLRVGLIHGHQVVPMGDKDALSIIQRKLDVDVLLSGATHSARVSEFDGHLFVNPGSITGAFTTIDCDVPPAFVLLDIRGKTVTSFTYHYVPAQDEAGEVNINNEDDGLRIKKKEWVKDG